MVHFRPILTGLVAVATLVSAADDEHEPLRSLGDVLESNRNLRTFDQLIRRFPDILLQLPSNDGITIIAPSNAAFENIPYTALNERWDPTEADTTMPILQYHILQGVHAIAGLEAGPSYMLPSLLRDSTYTNVSSGQNVFVNKQGDGGAVFVSGMGTRCSLEEADIPFQGGIIQVVDNLLIPPSGLDATSHAFGIPSFLGSLYAVELMPSLADRRNITVFAPQDAALAAVGGTLEDLDAEALARIIGYHVVPDRVLSSWSLSNGTQLGTLAEDGSGNAVSLTVRQSGNNKYINSAQIVQPDILLANGVLHIISNVLNPEANSVAPDPEIGTQPAVFPLETVSNAFTSALPCTVDCPVTTTSAQPTSDASTVSTEPTTTSLSTGTSDDAGVAQTANVAGAALGVLVFAGIGWL
ncbi:FAS1 domain-containing protein [Stachybotrys elegans]|uniref:FAS1 domain-containing protein n=1 Tax=Stachybotrys elegans TaxID=80388 RepID=A0A8K0SK52_9HYPO|nr:FAS1 domain-containing protein [Stachybotrys elegans]